MFPASEAPFFSIITPAYNRAAWLPAMIESVLAQTFTAWELVLIDDGSTDSTAEIVRRYKDNRIKYHFQENRERSASRNKGMDLAKGSFICFLDSDDYYLPDFLRGLHQAILNNGSAEALYCTGGILEKGNVRTEKQPPVSGTKKEMVRQFLNNSPWICTISFPAKWTSENRFKEDQTIWEDIHFWIRLAVKYPVIVVKEASVVVTEHPGRSATTFFSSLSLERFRQYTNNISDLFRIPEVGQYVSNKEQQEFLGGKYKMFVMEAAFSGQPVKFTYFSLRLLFNNPGFYMRLLPKLLIWFRISLSEYRKKRIKGVSV